MRFQIPHLGFCCLKSMLHLQIGGEWKGRNRVWLPLLCTRSLALESLSKTFAAYMEKLSTKLQCLHHKTHIQKHKSHSSSTINGLAWAAWNEPFYFPLNTLGHGSPVRYPFPWSFGFRLWWWWAVDSKKWRFHFICLYWKRLDLKIIIQKVHILNRCFNRKGMKWNWFNLSFSFLPCKQCSNSGLHLDGAEPSCMCRMQLLHLSVSQSGEEDSELSPIACYTCMPEVKK